ncbi:MAG: hypothetical protein L0H03_12685, partial [Rhodococcus sp. (in: high G+C Gram-positive bacteria)]|nr:hypothetical protein [Rhodococcus sp. (in: high G+C Gram-positive bacteria)]
MTSGPVRVLLTTGVEAADRAVAQRFEDAAASGTELDEVIDYVLTLRMRPIKVKLRLLAGAASDIRYVLIKRP